MAIARVKTWASEVLSATDLNAEFDNIISLVNLTPANINDYSATDTEMRTTIDPYPTGTASLATDLSGELARIRYVLAQITGETYWYVDPDASIAGIMAGTATVTNATNATNLTMNGEASASSTTAAVALDVGTVTSGDRILITLYAQIAGTGTPSTLYGYLFQYSGNATFTVEHDKSSVEYALAKTASTSYQGSTAVVLKVTGSGTLVLKNQVYYDISPTSYLMQVYAFFVKRG